jgi:hypothetical protein
VKSFGVWSVTVMITPQLGQVSVMVRGSVIREIPGWVVHASQLT